MSIGTWTDLATAEVLVGRCQASWICDNGIGSSLAYHGKWRLESVASVATCVLFASGYNKAGQVGFGGSFELSLSSGQ
jgi:hypothetical protein